MTNDPLQALTEAVAAEDDERAEAAALEVGRLGNSALPALQEMLASEDRDPRWWAVRALAAVGTEEAATALIGALDDPDPDVRACAVVGLAHLQPEAAIEPLIARLADPSAYVARLAADALARFGPAAAPALIGALKEGNVATRAGAARALRAIQPEEAVEALCEALDDPSAIVTYYAEDALDKMGVLDLFLFRP